MTYNYIAYLWGGGMLLLAGCAKDRQNPAQANPLNEPRRFELLPAEQTGVQFANKLRETTDLNIFTYLYMYNGAGVAVGDVNNDGLLDLYFTANQDKNVLYLNRGNFKFEDVTQAAEVGGPYGWKTGVTMVDINGDGLLDIYVSQVGAHQGLQGKNQLFINKGPDEKGIPLFEDEADKYGLGLVGYSTQAAFFDYDLDGDLDMYQLRHSVHNNGTFGSLQELRNVPHPTAGDKLLRNDNGRFTDVTEKAGIYSSVVGYGLGISTGDVNLDGYPDIYIGNDFHEDDYLYLNNGDGSFREVLNDCIGHTSRFSMGTDIADCNNDGLPDIISLDMLPADPVILKSSASEDPMDVFQFKLSYGYNYQYSRNNLQLNVGVRPNPKKGPNEVLFSEVGCAAGIYATDWSWSALFCDLDLDGRRDLYISNGIYRRSNDLDYIKFIEADSIQMRLKSGEIAARDLEFIKKMPQVKLPNYAFKNISDIKTGAVRFTDVAAAWGMGQPSYSNGTAYADLDNDGDLDMVVNNIEDPAFIYKNLTLDAAKPVAKDVHYLKLKFDGKTPNRFGVGARVLLDGEQGRIYQENYMTRGYQSSVAPEMVIGLGAQATVAQLTVIWPDGTSQILTNVPANQTLTLKQSEATGKYNYRHLLPAPVLEKPIFADVPTTLPYKHRENKFVEFSRERLIPNMNSSEGPRLAVGDVNGDKLDDFFIGGAKWQPGSLFVQQANGTFKAMPVPDFARDSTFEDIGAVFFDVDSDGDQDLAVASGGNEFREGARELQPRLYLNDGKGSFARMTDAFPNIGVNSSAIAPADYDNDGDQDLFLGGRSTPWNYGVLPRSFLLENDGKGHFRDVTTEKAPGLEKPGLIKDAVWADFNGDQKPDLALSGEWMPVTVFLNQGGKLALTYAPANESGWWNGLAAADLDSDGDLDLVTGNYGLNNKLNPSTTQPVSMYVDDFDGNQSIDQLLCYYYAGTERLFATKDELNAQMPSIKKQFLKYRDFAQAPLHKIVEQKRLDKAPRLFAQTFASAWFENNGQGQFVRHDLPESVQYSVVQRWLVTDINADKYPDLIGAGNFYDANPELGRYDASYGNVLLNDGKGNFRAIGPFDSGLIIKGQCRDIRLLRTAKAPVLVVARNNAAALFYKVDGFF
jgi:enediyne biosynthesis protein E4